ncbi:MAG: hypothetical protein NC127_06760 [Muribaculum sp.]|nr:hypothetical protein [Muribaculum sp.]
MKILKRIFVYTISFSSIISCGNSRDVRLALEEADDNQAGLERLLSETEGVEHRAVEFLIANMPGRGSFDGRTYQLLDSLLTPIGERESWEIYADGRETWNRHNYQSRTMTFDIQTLSPNYLSANVRDAVEQWKSRPHRGALSLLNIRAGNCVDDCDRTLYAMRSCGIPTAIDGFLVSPDNGGSHRWNVLIDIVSGPAGLSKYPVAV